MDASELSVPFGKKFCDIPGYTDCWVQFKTSGYPRKLRKEWDAADPDQTWAIVARYIVASELKDVDGNIVAFTGDTSNVEEAVYLWVIRTFAKFWLVELLQPRPNS